MVYKTLVVAGENKAKKLAACVEQAANEQAAMGWETVSFSVTASGKAILLLCSEKGEDPVCNAAEKYAAAEREEIVPEMTASAVGDAE